jgi:hypothetical protein
MTEFQDRRAAAAAEATAQPVPPAPPVAVVEAELDATKKRLDAERDREIYIAKHGADPVPAAPAIVLTSHERDIANAAVVNAAIPAPAEALGRVFKVGQRVTIKSTRRRGSINAVVTKASSVSGKKQELVECKTADGTVQEYWSDELA